jgi:CubicO group peptidase (beta-lactamase class C family)
MPLSAQQITKVDGSKINVDLLKARIITLMQKAKVKGIEVAIFNHNRTVFKSAFGIANDTRDSLLKTSTSIYGASLSKPLFAVLVLKLVEEGKLDLDKPLQEYLDKPIYAYPPKTKWQDHYEDLRLDSNYTKITARMCLMHTTGFPNWRWDNDDQKLKLASMPGSRYSYSGEGMVYLQTVIERMTGKTLDQLMTEKIFGPLAMKNAAYTFLPRFEASYAVGYNTEGKAYEKDKDNEARAPSTLETTFDDYVTFIEAVMQGRILKKPSTAEMFRPQIRLKSAGQFGPMAHKETTENAAISLSYGLGWGLLKSPYGLAAFKEGHGDGFQHYCILFPKAGIGIVIMTNSDNGESTFKELLELAIADKYTPWRWQNYIPYNHDPNQ